MEYTIQKLGRMAGVSTRTLRYYDEVGLLKPARINSSGYRIYGLAEVDRLQQILFYRELGMGLENISELISSPSFDEVKALKEHRQQLLDKRAQLDLLLINVDKSIALKEGRIIMTDQEKFEGFKQKLIDDNEARYGKEVREKYGDQAADQANARIKSMSPSQYDEVNRLGQEVLETLYKAVDTGDPAGDLAQKAADLHRQWLTFFWNKYSKEAHAGVARMYVEDERFKKYYDEKKPGAAAFLRDAVLIYTGTQE
ncbi:MAG: MerR family transcriptional regulator [Methylocystaceae bacterium]